MRPNKKNIENRLESRLPFLCK